MVRVDLAGICATDLEIMNGYKNNFRGILGHEMVGTVVELETDDKWDVRTTEKLTKMVGRRACVEINSICSNCDRCKLDDEEAEDLRNVLEGINSPKLTYKIEKREVMRRNHCKNRSVLGIWNCDQGAFSKFITIPVRNLVLLPRDQETRAEIVPDEVAVFIEPLAAALRIIEQVEGAQVPITQDTNARKVAVVGDGKLGLLLVLVLLLQKQDAGDSFGDIVLVGKHAEKLDLMKSVWENNKNLWLNSTLRKRLERFEVVNITTASEQSRLRNLSGNVDVVVAATGSTGGLTLAADLCRPLGSFFLKTTCAASPENHTGIEGYRHQLVTLVEFLNIVVVKELKVIGSRCGPMRRAVKFLLDDHNKEFIFAVLKKMVSRTFSLSEIKNALEYIKREKPLKVLIKP